MPSNADEVLRQKTARSNLIERMAKLMAAAYWRGRLETALGGPAVDQCREAMILAAAEKNYEPWREAAALAIRDYPLPGD